jgi:hypothetical protein
MDKFEDELDARRIAIYEQIKDMSVEERVKFFNDDGSDTAKEYSFTVVNDISEAVYAHLKSKIKNFGEAEIQK